MSTFAPEYVEAPPVTPLPYGLFSTALVLDNLDPRSLMAGVHYEPGYCGPALETAAACMGLEDLGEAAVSVDDAGVATLTLTDHPDGIYTVVWPNGSASYTHTMLETGVDSAALDPDEDYVVTVTGPRGWRAVVTFDVEDGVASAEPFEGVLTTDKQATEGIPSVLGSPFVLYHLFRCKMPAGGLQRGEERARESLSLGEGRAAEAIVARQMATTVGAVDLTPTPGTAIHMVDGVAELEQWAAENYGGVPVIHTPRGVTTRLGAEGILERNNSAGRLETDQGALIASGGGYSGLLGPGGDAPDPGEAWLYVTGAVVARRTPVQATPPVLGRDSGNMTNDFVTLAERGYVVTWECITGAVLVSTTYKDPV